MKSTYCVSQENPNNWGQKRKYLEMSIIFMKRLFMRLLLTVVLILFLVSLFFQFKVEQYLAKSQLEYGVFIEKKRIHYTPFVVFYYKGRINKDFYKMYFHYIHFPYYEQGLIENYIINYDYGTYLIYCYYTIKELEALTKSLGNKNPIKQRKQ